VEFDRLFRDIRITSDLLFDFPKARSDPVAEPVVFPANKVPAVRMVPPWQPLPPGQCQFQRAGAHLVERGAAARLAGNVGMEMSRSAPASSLGSLPPDREKSGVA
jgi:hypothetical protein